MEPSTCDHDNAWTMTAELFSTPFAPDILLFLKWKQGCSEEELKGRLCDGKSPRKALEFLTDKGLAESEDGKIMLTSKGEKAVGIINQIGSLFSDNQR